MKFCSFRCLCLSALLTAGCQPGQAGSGTSSADTSAAGTGTAGTSTADPGTTAVSVTGGASETSAGPGGTAAVTDSNLGDTTTTGATGSTTEVSTSDGHFIILPDPEPLVCNCAEDQLCVVSVSAHWYLTCAVPPAGCDPADMCTAACASACVDAPPLPTNCAEEEPPEWVLCTPGFAFECSTWAENCPAGEKCVPGEDILGGLDCQPLVEPAAAIGELCSGPLDGEDVVDTCVQGAGCWGHDPVTNETVCVAHCTGTPTDPGCPPDTGCMITDQGKIAVCLPSCDPLVQDCGIDSKCVLGVEDFVCVRDEINSKPAPGKCKDTTGCDPGLACFDSEQLPGCDNAAFCCTPYCDLGAPDCEAGLTCVPMFAEGEAPPDAADVGACAAPP